MNYNKFIKNGFQYVLKAVNNWCHRENNLMSIWHSKHPRKEKLSKLINCLHERINCLRKIIYEHNQTQKEFEIEAQHQIVFLECPNFKCKYGPESVYTGVKLKDYVPDKLKCSKCGEPLTTKENLEIDYILFENNIAYEQLRNL